MAPGRRPDATDPRPGLSAPRRPDAVALVTGGVAGTMRPPPATPFTALVLAGARAPDDPVAKAAGVPVKSLARVGGTPMVLRVLLALEEAREVGERVLCGPDLAAVEQEVELRRRLVSRQFRWIEQCATPSASAHHAMQSLPADVPVLVTTADHALLTAEMIDYFCARARTTGCEVVVGVAPLDLVAAAHPETRRTVMRLRDGSYCGCNLFAFLTPRARTAAAFWCRVEEDRKNPRRVIAVLGWMAVLRYLLGRLSLADGLDRISRRLGLSAGAVVMPFPDAAIDVDTVGDLRLVQARLDGRPR
jgi:GTP:adenosylcobinamide-phosphate guanylyltransferase